MNTHLVFIYGSLRRGSAGAMAIRFPTAKFVGDAKVSGELYDLGAYPGLVLGAANSLVVGEAYEVDEELLNELDAFETSSDYLRKPVEIFLDDQQKSGWVYGPDPEVYPLRTLITSGDWIEYAKTSKDDGNE